MRPATLYTLQATDIVAGDYHCLVRSNLRPVFTTNPNEAIAPMDIDQFAVPIHRVTRIRRTSNMPLHIDPWQHEDREDFFFALEPALEEIISAPFVHIADEAKDELRKCENLYQCQQSLINGFKDLPWWKQVWKTATGNMGF